MTVYTWSQTADNNATADTSIDAREGMAPRKVNDSMRAMMAAVAKWRDDTSGKLTTGGTSTAYTLTTNQSVASLEDGLSLTFTAHATNGASPTLNVDSRGAKPLRGLTGTNIGAGYMIAGTPYRVTYFTATDEFLLHDAPLQAFVVPIGGLIDYAGSTAPSSNFAFPYGQAVSRTTYATLFDAISTTYGTGDGSTTFNLPDLRGRVIVGKDNMGGSTASRVTSASGITGTTLGAAGGAQTFTITKTYLPDYTLFDNLSASTSISNGTNIARNQSFNSTASTDGPEVPNLLQGGSVTTDITASTSLSGSVKLDGGGSAMPLMQPSIILNKLIRVL